jgi:hypothetical protein
VTSLEERAAELRGQLREKFAQGSENRGDIVACIAGATLAVESPRVTSFFDDLTLSTLCYTPSVPPLAVSRHANSAVYWNHNGGGDQRDQAPREMRPPRTHALDLKKVPQSAIVSMLRIYTTSLLHHYPIVDRAFVQDIYQSIYEPQSVSHIRHFDYFVLYTILSISSITLAWKTPQQACALSLAFFSSALQHLRRVSDLHGLPRLQALLLLAHYAHVNPMAASAWACTAAAVRTSLDLGLIEPSASETSQEEQETRQRLFWVTYDMDRGLSAMLRLPLSFPEESIHHTVPEVAATQNTQHCTSRHLYSYRRIETEVHRVLHLLEDTAKLRSQGLDAWLISIESALEEWYVNSEHALPTDSLPFLHTMYFYLKAKIYRPTPRLPNRCSKDQQMCFELCKHIIESVSDLSKVQQLTYTWQAAHILFGAAILLLNVCWECRALPWMQPSAIQVLSNVIPRCLGLLDTIGIMWKGARVCASHIRSILDEVARPYSLNIELESPPMIDEAMTTERLQALLFADRPPHDDSVQDGTLSELDLQLFDSLSFNWDLENSEFFMGSLTMLT